MFEGLHIILIPVEQYIVATPQHMNNNCPRLGPVVSNGAVSVVQWRMIRTQGHSEQYQMKRGACPDHEFIDLESNLMIQEQQ